MLCNYDQAAFDSENSHRSHKCGGVDQRTQRIPTNSGSFSFQIKPENITSSLVFRIREVL